MLAGSVPRGLRKTRDSVANCAKYQRISAPPMHPTMAANSGAFRFPSGRNRTTSRPTLIAAVPSVAKSTAPGKPKWSRSMA